MRVATELRHSTTILILSVVLAAWFPRPALAVPQPISVVENLYFDDVSTGRDGQAVVELFARAMGPDGEPASVLRAQDWVVVDNGATISQDDLTVETLAETEAGMSCVLAIDVSRTMRGETFERARAAALDFVRSLGPNDRIALVAFSDEVAVLADFDTPRSEMTAELEFLEVDSLSLTTVLYDGLHEAINLIRLARGTPRRSVIIVFSDGKDAGSLRSLEQVKEYGRGSQFQPPVLIFAIGYARFGGDGLPVLEALSRTNGGLFLRARKESPREIAAFFDRALSHIRESLVLSYEGDLDGREHLIEIATGERVASRTALYAKADSSLMRWIIGAAGGALIVVALSMVLAKLRRRPRLRFTNGPCAGRSIPLAGPYITIGALAENQIVLDDDMVSRHHAAISLRDRRTATLQDLGSSNGTFVNGERITTSGLELGDRVRFADIEAIHEK